METIIAGRFATHERAERAVNHLIADGFHHNDASTFFVNPPGQHDQLPIGGDQDADASATKADAGAVAGAAVGGAAGVAAALLVPGIGPALALGVIGVGAYTGSLAGALTKLGDHKAAQTTDASPGRPSGVLVAVRVLNPKAEDLALNVLQEEGAEDIERKLGIWEAGEWKDFDPVAPPDLVDEREHARTNEAAGRSKQ
jgi:hypothetical protein